MASWAEMQRCRFIADWHNDKGLLDIDSQPQEGEGTKRSHENEPETSTKRRKDDDYFTVKSAKQIKVRKFNTTGTDLYVLILGYELCYVSGGLVVKARHRHSRGMNSRATPLNFVCPRISHYACY